MAPPNEFAGYICGIEGALPEDEGIYNGIRRRIQNK